MKHFASPFRLGAVLALATVGAAALVFAQRPAPQPPPTAPAAAATQVKIKAIPRPGKGVMVSTPDFGARATGLSQPLSRGRPKEWAVIDVTYETKSPAKWTDNVYVTFYVMTEGMTPDRKKELSFYTLRVQYVNVADGEHRAGVVLAPSTLERFGQGGVVAIAAEITADGAAQPDVKSEHTLSDLNPYKDDWWKNDRILNAEIVKRRDGLLERSKTPFGLIHMDDYEAVR